MYFFCEDSNLLEEQHVDGELLVERPVLLGEPVGVGVLRHDRLLSPVPPSVVLLLQVVVVLENAPDIRGVGVTAFLDDFVLHQQVCLLVVPVIF